MALANKMLKIHSCNLWMNNEKRKWIKMMKINDFKYFVRRCVCVDWAFCMKNENSSFFSSIMQKLPRKIPQKAWSEKENEWGRESVCVREGWFHLHFHSLKLELKCEILRFCFLNIDLNVWLNERMWYIEVNE